MARWTKRRAFEAGVELWRAKKSEEWRSKYECEVCKGSKTVRNLGEGVFELFCLSCEEKRGV